MWRMSLHSVTILFHTLFDLKQSTSVFTYRVGKVSDQFCVFVFWQAAMGLLHHGRGTGAAREGGVPGVEAGSGAGGGGGPSSGADSV